MSSYCEFSSFYDLLTENVNYKNRCEYFNQIIKQFGNGGNLLLDLACGTGSLSLEFNKLNFDVIGTDISEDMLSIAMEKAYDENANILFLCQSMQNLDLYGTIDVVVCALDSINHVTNKEQVLAAFKKVSLFLDPNGVFIFDVNSKYKHEKILSNNTFVYETDSVFCVWQNEFEEETCTVNINLDFFESDGEHYHRYSESFSERAYSHEEILTFLKQSGLKLIKAYEGDTFNDFTDTSERIVYVAKKDI